eukprot:COSAG01_NODE_30867_length_608_cov_0.793713_1_plen_25_part_01
MLAPSRQLVTMDLVAEMGAGAYLVR